MKEKDLERAFVKAVEKRGGLALKFTVPGRRGVPDRLVLLPGGGRAFVEFKHPHGTGRVSKLQDRFAEQLRALQHPVYLVRTSFDAVAVILDLFPGEETLTAAASVTSKRKR